jgi:hypothetical protein
MKTFKVLVEIELDIEDDYVNHPIHGIELVAQRYANMATHYDSIGANSSKVVEIKESE